MVKINKINEKQIKTYKQINKIKSVSNFQTNKLDSLQYQDHMES